MCTLCRSGYYKKVDSHVDYDQDEIYGIDENTNSFTMISFEKGCLSEKRYEMKIWDSARVWKDDQGNVRQPHTLSGMHTLFEEKRIKEAPIEQGGNKEYMFTIGIHSEELLYGGEDNWYYGIWLGDVSAFDIRKAQEQIKQQYKRMSKEEAEQKEKELKEKEKELKNTENKNVQNPSQEKKSRIYGVKTGFYESDAQGKAVAKIIVEEESKKELTHALIGEVNAAIVQEAQYDSEGNKSYKNRNTYYSPFILEDSIHTNRSGALSYYTIPGLYKKSETTIGSANFSMPAVKKTRSKGSDESKGADIGSPVRTAKIHKLAELAKEPFNPGIALSISDNKSESYQIQSIQDMNADGIPDIVVKQKDGVSVIAGRKTDQTVIYDKLYTLNAEELALCENEVKVNGANFSPSGSISVQNKGNGAVKSISFNGNGSAGVSVSNGTSSQKKGFVDINGDGIADYIKGENAYIGNGERFTDYVFATGDISKSENFTIGATASIGKGGSLNTASDITPVAVSIGVALSYSASAVQAKQQLMDINADGLVDRVYKQGNSFFVCYNLGNRFDLPQEFSIPSWNIDPALLLQYSTHTDGNMIVSAVKGVPIIGEKADSLIGQTEGIGFNPYGITLESMSNELDFSSTLSLSISGSLNMGATIPIWVPFTSVTVNATISGSAGANANVSLSGATVKMFDINGDGLADQVLRIPGEQGGIWVKENLCGKADLLKKIRLPQGGSYELFYELKKGTVENPHSKYVLARLDKIDGMQDSVEGGIHRYTERYSYEKGYYDRNLRDFYGFGRVHTYSGEKDRTGSNIAYTEKTTQYYNDAYYRKGMEQSIEEKAEDPYSKENTVYRVTHIELENEPYAQVKQKSETNSEANAQSSKRQVSYRYDSYRNVTSIEEMINDDTNSILQAHIEYESPNDSLYLHNHPSVICVYDSERKLLRKRKGSYNRYGSLISLKQYSSENESLESMLSYTDRGELKRITDSKGITVEYEYSTNGFMNAIKQRGSQGAVYESSIDWDEQHGLKLSETDINENTIRYSYDSFGRLTAVYSPYDNQAGTACLRYSYHTPKQETAAGLQRWYTITENKVLFEPTDTTVIRTINEIDGLGRTVRTGKTGIVYKDRIKQKGWNVSGSSAYDAKARAVKTYMTTFVAGQSEQDFLQAPVYHSDTPYTINCYDGLDRTVEQVLPDNSVYKNIYRIEAGKNVSEQSDPLGNITVSYSDVRGNTVGIEKKDSSAKVLTKARYEYDVLGQMLTAYPADQRYPVTVSYDMLGRKTALSSSDSGTKEYVYNSKGQLAWESDSVLRTKGVRISYEYDQFGRIEKIDYPYSTDTVYEYGKAGEPYNRAGKIVRVTDETGEIEYKYGKLGETVEEKRSIAHMNSFVHKEKTTALMSYTSDYLGRMQQIVYPDTEVVRYAYDEGGQVVSIQGSYAGITTEYVKDIGYDEYGQRVFIEYGNGVKTEYTYNKERRWLDKIQTQRGSESYQNIAYRFDTVGNVLGYTNDTSYYSTEQNYTYDSLYQLTEAQGKSINKPYGPIDYISNYKQTFSFDNSGMGNIVGKESTVVTEPQRNIGENINYRFDYEYDGNYAHRVKRIGQRYYQYDANGNVILEQDEPIGEKEEESYTIHELTENVYGIEYGWALENEEETKPAERSIYKRRYRWNERNLMQESSDNTQSVHYRYGQDGQRALKSSNQSETLYFNTMWSWLHNSSAYNTDRESKHIYLGTERLVTRMNGAGTQGNAYTAQVSTYYYHSDHLGSAQLITDNEGREYERIEYTPYGEYWVEKRAPENRTLPFKFTGKERDEETGLYYYGARYMDPRTSRWLSADPALTDYIPMAPVDDNARKHNQNLPGMGGIYNSINMHLYHYAGNNPVKYIDPTGKWTATLGIGSGLAAKVKFGVNAGKFEFTWRIGFGIGGAAKFDFADKENITEDQKGVYLEANVDIETPEGGASVTAKIAVEGVTQRDGESSLVIQNDASFSITGPNGETSTLELDNGQYSIANDQNSEVGAETMLFLGFGGAGCYEIE